MPHQNWGSSDEAKMAEKEKKTSSERWMTVQDDVENRYTLGKYYETNGLYFLQLTQRQNYDVIWSKNGFGAKNCKPLSLLTICINKIIACWKKTVSYHPLQDIQVPHLTIPKMQFQLFTIVLLFCSMFFSQQFFLTVLNWFLQCLYLLVPYLQWMLNIVKL